jgi:hypothetical protein
MIKVIVPLVIALAAASAASAAEYRIVRGPDHNCRVLEKSEPADKTVTIVGNKRYVTRDEAEKDIKVVCRH